MFCCCKSDLSNQQQNPDLTLNQIKNVQDHGSINPTQGSFADPYGLASSNNLAIQNHIRNASIYSYRKTNQTNQNNQTNNLPMQRKKIIELRKNNQNLKYSLSQKKYQVLNSYQNLTNRVKFLKTEYTSKEQKANTLEQRINSFLFSSPKANTRPFRAHERNLK